MPLEDLIRPASSPLGDLVVPRVRDPITPPVVEPQPELNANLSKIQRYPLHGVAEVAGSPGAITGLAGLATAGVQALTSDLTFRQAMHQPVYRYWVGELADAERRGDEQRMQEIMTFLPEDHSLMLRPSIRAAMDFYNIGTQTASAVSKQVFNEEFEREPGQVPWDEEAIGIGLSALVGAPGTLVGKATLKGATSTLGKGAVIAGRTLEAATPLTLPLTPGNVVFNAAAGNVVNDLMRGLNAEDSLTKIIMDTATPDEALEAYAPPEVQDEEGGIGIGTIAAGAAVVGALGVALRGKYRLGTPKTVIEAGPALQGARPETATGLRSLLTAGAEKVSEGQGLVNKLRQTQGVETAEAFMDTLTMNTRSGGDAGVRHFAATGELFDSGITTVPPGEIANRVATLTPEQMDILNEGAIAINVKRDRQLNSRPIATEWTGADLTARIDALDADPQVRGIYDAIQQVYRDLADYRYRSGDIDLQTRQQFASDWDGAYIPNRSAEEPELSRTQRFLRGWLSSNDTSGRTPRDRGRGDRGVNIFQADVLKGLDEYAGRVVRRVQNNKARRTFVDMMGFSDPNTSSVVKGAERFAPESMQIRRVPNKDVKPAWRQTGDIRPQPDRNIVRITRNGKDEFYEFGNDYVARALEFNPHKAIGILSVTRKLWQQGTTGILAPARAPLAATWDTIIGTLTRPPRTSMGYLDDLALKLTGGKTNLQVFDPTSFIRTGVGAARGITGATLRDFHQWLTQGLLDGSSMFSSLASTPAGRAAVDKLAQDVLNRYRSSTYYLMHSHGFSQTHWLEDSIGLHSKVIGASSSSKLPATGPVHATFNDYLMPPAKVGLRAYQNIMDAIHNSAKYAFVARNLAIREKQLGRPLTNKEITRLTRQARQLSGDMTRHVDFGPALTKTIDAFPYANVAAQSMAHLYRAGTRPETAPSFWLSVATLAGAYTAMTHTIEQMGGADWYNNDVPAWQRGSSMIMPKFDAWLKWYTDPDSYEFDPNDMTMVRLPPEIMPMVLVGDYVANWLAGQETIRNKAYGDRDADLRSAFVEMLGVPAPPLVQAAIGAAGYESDVARIIEDADTDALIKQRKQSRLAGFHDATRHNNAFLNDNIHFAVAGVMGTFGERLSQMGDAANAALTSGEDTDAVFNAALTEYRQRESHRLPLASVWKGYNKKYVGTPAADRVYDMEHDLDGIFRQAGLELGNQAGRVDVGNIAPRIADPVAMQMVLDSYAWFNTNTRRSDYKRRINELKTQRQAILGDFRISPNQRDAATEDITEQIQAYYRSLAQDNEQFIATMKSRFGPAWTVDQMKDLVEQSIQSTP